MYINVCVSYMIYGVPLSGCASHPELHSREGSSSAPGIPLWWTASLQVKAQPWSRPLDSPRWPSLPGGWSGTPWTHRLWNWTRWSWRSPRWQGTWTKLFKISIMCTAVTKYIIQIPKYFCDVRFKLQNINLT